MEKFIIHYWEVHLEQYLEDTRRIVVTTQETYTSDSLREVLTWLRQLQIPFDHLNRYTAPEYDVEELCDFCRVLSYANVYHYGKPLCFQSCGRTRWQKFLGIPESYTACGLKRKKKCPKKYVCKHSHRNLRHWRLEQKGNNFLKQEALDLETKDCWDASVERCLKRWKQLPLPNCWDFNDYPIRSRKTQSWKNKKQKHQWG